MCVCVYFYYNANEETNEPDAVVAKYTIYQKMTIIKNVDPNINRSLKVIFSEFLVVYTRIHVFS